MHSLRELYRMGMGPSSSHTMGPHLACQIFRERHPRAAAFRVTLYGSLAATGKGHLTDRAIADALEPIPVKIEWHPEITLPQHPNGMMIETLDSRATVADRWTVFSTGGGTLHDETGRSIPETSDTIYDFRDMTELLAWSEQTGQPLWQKVDDCEGESIWDFLRTVWQCMGDTIGRGLRNETALPGRLHLQRKASRVFRRSRSLGHEQARTSRVSAFALACSEENASGGRVITAPTCGACGVLPAVLYDLARTEQLDEFVILRALATAGLVGNIAKHNASISGAEVGCQGEVGVACSMAAAAMAQILGGSPPQIEYAAEMGLEHHLGLTCDPIDGQVQIPCIERNAMAALRALNCAEYSLLSDGRHYVSFDQVVRTMLRTGKDLPSIYRETSLGGLASQFSEQQRPDDTPTKADERLQE